MKTLRLLSVLLLLSLGATLLQASDLPFSEEYDYEGPYNSAGKAHGKGEAAFINGDIYKGDFLEGFPSGTGTYIHKGYYDTDPSAYTYQGGILKAAFHGKGKITWADGSYYKGQFDRNQFDGYGERLLKAKQQLYKGMWEQGKMHGKGYLKIPEFHYEGNFAKSKFHGPGKIVFANGRSLEGNFSEGDLSGFARMVLPEGARIEGNYEYGEFQGIVKIEHPSGDLYQGEHWNYKAHGKGRLVKSETFVYEGEFDEGAFSGQGKITWVSGDSYEGGFFNNQMHGKGTLTHSGNVFVGEFSFGKPHGKGTCNGTPCEFKDGVREE